MKQLTLLIFVLISLLKVEAQTFNLACDFRLVSGFYGCYLDGVTVPDNEELNIVVSGTHLVGRTNADVQDVFINFSNIPFIVRQLFISFPNLSSFHIWQSGLTRLRSGDFANASSLRFLLIRNNPNLRTIGENTFVGGSNILSLDLMVNGIESIHETAFNGLTTVGSILLNTNLLSSLPVNLFASLTSLNTVFMSNNNLQSLDGRLFANNRQLHQLQISQNQINSIGRNFLDGMNLLQILGLNGNRCVSNNWQIDGNFVTLETVRQGLQVCFDNFVEPGPEPEGELRRFVLELRGPLSLRFENGTEIVRV